MASISNCHNAVPGKLPPSPLILRAAVEKSEAAEYFLRIVERTGADVRAVLLTIAAPDVLLRATTVAAAAVGAKLYVDAPVNSASIKRSSSVSKYGALAARISKSRP